MDTCVAPDSHDADDDQRLKTIQRLWHELQATPEGSEKYEDLVRRIRQEADLFWGRTIPPDPEPSPRHPSPLRCPNCQSEKTIQTLARPTERMFFCSRCGHSWIVESNDHDRGTSER